MKWYKYVCRAKIKKKKQTNPSHPSGNFEERSNQK